MSEEMKLLTALCEALGFEVVKGVEPHVPVLGAEFPERTYVLPEATYTLTKKEAPNAITTNG